MNTTRGSGTSPGMGPATGPVIDSVIDPLIDTVLTGPWCRVLSMAAPEAAGTAEADYAAVQPAALAAVTAGHPLAVAWLSRGDGADLRLITMAASASSTGPVRRGKHAAPAAPTPEAPAPAAGGPEAHHPAQPADGPPLLFPPGA